MIVYVVCVLLYFRLHNLQTGHQRYDIDGVNSLIYHVWKIEKLPLYTRIMVNLKEREILQTVPQASHGLDLELEGPPSTEDEIRSKVIGSRFYKDIADGAVYLGGLASRVKSALKLKVNEVEGEITLLNGDGMRVNSVNRRGRG